MTTNNNNAERGFGFGFNFRVPEKMDVDGDDNYVPKDPDVLQFRNELVKNILSLTDLITEKERKVELSKMIYENEVSELAELQNRKKDLVAQKGCVKRAEKLINQKKRRRDLDGYNNQLDDYLNDPEEESANLSMIITENVLKIQARTSAEENIVMPTIIRCVMTNYVDIDHITVLLKMTDETFFLDKTSKSFFFRFSED